MKNNGKIYAFLRKNGFDLLEKDASISFGDYSDIFANGIFQLRFSSSKLYEMVDIQIDQPNERWYDLALVRALLYNERDLNTITTSEEHLHFLQTEFTAIGQFFNDQNYATTKKRLEKLGNERVKQMFPTIRT